MGEIPCVKWIQYLILVLLSVCRMEDYILHSYTYSRFLYSHFIVHVDMIMPWIPSAIWYVHDTLYWQKTKDPNHTICVSIVEQLFLLRMKWYITEISSLHININKFKTPTCTCMFSYTSAYINMATMLNLWVPTFFTVEACLRRGRRIIAWRESKAIYWRKPRHVSPFPSINNLVVPSSSCLLVAICADQYCHDHWWVVMDM